MPYKRKPHLSHSIRDKVTTYWNPAKFLEALNPYSDGGDLHFMLLTLNQPIENRALFLVLSRLAIAHYCADGGANRVKDLKLSKKEEKDCTIDFICGDLDSIRPDVRKHYEDANTTIIWDPDQNSTDITKCLKHMRDQGEDEFDIVILGGLGGRADQAFSQLHHLYVANETVPNAQGIYLITPESIVFLLDKGENVICTPTDPSLLCENVGIIPIGRPSTITTQGLEWDVDGWQTEFGTQLSTSNHIKHWEVTITTTERVLFTVEITKASNNANSHVSAKRRRIDNDDGRHCNGQSNDMSLTANGHEVLNSSTNGITNGSVLSASNDNIASRIDRLERLVKSVSAKVPAKVDRLERLINNLTEEVSIIAKQHESLLEEGNE